jgi:transcriptional regulator with XRE-family HTH domain
VERHRCEECGRELADLQGGPSPVRCEDCIPDTGPGSPLVERLATNLRRLRDRTGIERPALARRAALKVEELSRFEDGAHELSATRALRLAHSMGVSIEELVERVYWNPGETARRPGDRRPFSERLAGFFQVVPDNAAVFDPPLPRDPVGSRLEAAAVLGQNVRAARERRHLTQAKLARAAGLSKAGLSLIERGVRETTIDTLLSLARSLEVAPAFLLGGIAWEAHRPSCADAARQGRAQRHDAHSLDGPIKRLWGEGRTAGEIAEAVGASPGAVSAIVHRLREHGDRLTHRSPPTRAVHEGARQRRGQRIAATPSEHDSAAADRKQSADEAGQPEVSEREAAARMGANVAFHRQAAGLTLRELGEATEVDRAYLHRIENGRAGVPRISLVVKLAASLNVSCARVVAGIVWDPSVGRFRLEAKRDEDAGRKRLGQNVRRGRRKVNISQQALGALASMCRGDVVDFERGTRNFRIFAAVRLAGALGVDLADLFSGVGGWYVRPLPAPEYGSEDRPPTKAERDALLARLWREGRPERDIADALDLKISAVGSYVRELRDVGKHLPYRRPPADRQRAQHVVGAPVSASDGMTVVIGRRPCTSLAANESSEIGHISGIRNVYAANAFLRGMLRINCVERRDWQGYMGNCRKDEHGEQGNSAQRKTGKKTA